MSEQARDKDVTLRLGTEYWVHALVIAPVLIDVVLGLVLFLTDDEYMTMNPTAKVAVMVAWPILSGLAAFVIVRYLVREKVGAAINRVSRTAFLAIATMAIVWSPFVGILLAILFETDGAGGDFD